MNVLSVVITFIVMMLFVIFVIFVSILILEVIDIFKEEKSYKEIIHDIDQEILSGMEALDAQYNSKKDIEYKIELQKRYEL